MDLNQAVKQHVREVMLEIFSEHGLLIEPELIDIEQVSTLLDLNEKTVREMCDDAEITGFPAIWLGKRTLRFDKARLILWLNAGGLRRYGQHHEGRQAEVQGSHLKAVAKAA